MSHHPPLTLLQLALALLDCALSGAFNALLVLALNQSSQYPQARPHLVAAGPDDQRIFCQSTCALSCSASLKRQGCRERGLAAGESACRTGCVSISYRPTCASIAALGSIEGELTAACSLKHEQGCAVIQIVMIGNTLIHPHLKSTI